LVVPLAGWQYNNHELISDERSQLENTILGIFI